MPFALQAPNNKYPEWLVPKKTKKKTYASTYTRTSHTQVHFRSGIGGDSKITETAYAILHDLDGLNQLVKSKCTNLEQALSQLDVYQQQMQSLRQKIIQEEQLLRQALAPTYLPHDRDKAITEQQVSHDFESVRFVMLSLSILLFTIFTVVD